MSKEDFEIDPSGDIDEQTFALMQAREKEDARGSRNVHNTKEPPLPTSRYLLETLRKTKEGKVLVRCVSSLRPWASGSQMYFWRDYEVTPEEAILLDRRRFCVILQPPKPTEQENVNPR